MNDFEKEVSDFQKSQENNIKNAVSDEFIVGSDKEIINKTFIECLEKSQNTDDFKKSFSGDLQKRFPNGGWRTINGAKVFVNGGKVVAGLDGFNKEIDTFFDKKKKPELKKLMELASKLNIDKNKQGDTVALLSKTEKDLKNGGMSKKYYDALSIFQDKVKKYNKILDEIRDIKKNTQSNEEKRDYKRAVQENKVTSTTYERFLKRQKKDVENFVGKNR